MKKDPGNLVLGFEMTPATDIQNGNGRESAPVAIMNLTRSAAICWD
jgi:hypothetical protein